MKNLKAKYLTQKKLREHYETMFKVATDELRFSQTRIENYRKQMAEVEVLASSGIDGKLISKLIHNFIQRDTLDISIHYDSLGK